MKPQNATKIVLHMPADRVSHRPRKQAPENSPNGRSPHDESQQDVLPGPHPVVSIPGVKRLKDGAGIHLYSARSVNRQVKQQGVKGVRSWQGLDSALWITCDHHSPGRIR